MPLMPPLPSNFPDISTGSANMTGFSLTQINSDGIPPLPSGSVSSGSTDQYGLPNLPTLPALSGIGGSMLSNITNAVNPASSSNGSSSVATSDSFVAKIAYLALGVVIIAGAIYVYRK